MRAGRVDWPVSVALAQSVPELPTGTDWSYEVKLDGHRMIMWRTDEGGRLQARSGRDVTAVWGDLALAGLHLPAGTALDGEAVITTEDGRISFEAAQARAASSPTRAHQLVRRAQPQAVVLSAHDNLAGFVRNFPQTARELRLDDTALAELLGGGRDVFAASCADQLSGLHGPAGQPCPARPWVCLLCPLAVSSPRHQPNLMRLRAYFARQWRLMPAAVFLSVFGPYAQRLDGLLTHRPVSRNARCGTPPSRWPTANCRCDPRSAPNDP
ncbi:hypothetical protein ACFV2U_28785 [Streptomyces sp. NPDC059697]|uniref:ATP-dependent DNA ligase n=1 Tax=Streptomyces sp. NPDC059697 TaxID=3346912 RepID=UPI00369079E3